MFDQSRGLLACNRGDNYYLVILREVELLITTYLHIKQKFTGYGRLGFQVCVLSGYLDRSGPDTVAGPADQNGP